MAAPAVAPILPGGTLGILGGGQLGAMFAMAARRMGYRVEAISDVADCPAAIHCDHLHVGAYTDTALLARVAAGCDVITFEFENIPAEAGRALAAAVPVRPSPDVLFTTQDRAREKTFLTQHGFACAPYRIVHSLDELRRAAADLGLPSVLKTAAFGYDGKGQMKLLTPPDIDAAWATLGTGPDGPRQLVLEGFIDFDCEISVVAARGADGSVAVFPPSRNAHANHILDVSSVPAGRAHSTTRSRRGRTTRGTSRSRPARPRSLSSRFARSAGCRSAPRGCGRPPRWQTCSATAGRQQPTARTATQTGPRRSRCQACGCTSTASARPDPAARWATSRPLPRRSRRPWRR